MREADSVRKLRDRTRNEFVSNQYSTYVSINIRKEDFDEEGASPLSLDIEKPSDEGKRRYTISIKQYRAISVIASHESEYGGWKPVLIRAK